MTKNPFVSSLERLHLQKDRAALARLRRGLGKRGGTPEMYPYIVPWLPPESFRSEQERYFLVASLFAFHPEHGTGMSIGKVFRALGDPGSSIEKRFTRLLSADVEDLHSHLRQAVSLAKSKGVRIDYHQLFEDLGFWKRGDKRRIQLDWSRDYWGYLKPEAETLNSEAEPKGEEE